MTVSVQAFLRAPVEAGEAKPHYLHPGQLFFSTEPALVSTVLGSCVSVCLFAPASGIGGINHYLLPEKLTLDSPRFGDVANRMLLERFDRAGVERSSLHAKVFGGASMGGMRVGDLASRNADAAISFLNQHEIRVVSSDLGGKRGRKLVFRIEDGSAWVRLL